TDEQIFSDEESLTKYLLFGSSNTEKEYTVKAGDTIESVAFNNKLNEEEFLIVNPEFTSSKNLLSIGQKVNIALINPILKMVVEKHIVEDMEKPYE
ncbi:MAG: LysM domain-containing protein, partial [Intestinibacter bartlettii]|uniref:LysM peptidoglycan-binding domain-containing protein n=1 Tax=Intestinibacter bartlettii TaxID=261299 RepID=UPI0026E98C7E